jgi:arsenate reductase-like glutaredoxin family protein
MAVKKTKEVEEQVIEKKTKVRKLDDKTVVTVISNFPGFLYYRDPRTQDEFEFAEYGDEHEMTLQQLKTMKAQHRRFFEDKWITFAEHEAEDIIKYLKVEKYFKDGVAQDDLEDIFEKSVEEIADIIDTATANEKSLILTKAREKYESGELVNTHIIKLIEDKLQVDIDINNPK